MFRYLTKIIFLYRTQRAEIIIDMIRKNDYIGFEELIAESITLMNQLTALKKGELKRIQGQSGSTKVSMVYLNMVQQAYYDYTCQTGDFIKMCTVPSLRMDESDLVKEKKMLTL